ncbi:MAG TPA: hypothetical protein EYP14_11075 [Planctomycetaceae bacterium]|nr:hypothetical protein [Planctomycetaceae bacterium]
MVSFGPAGPLATNETVVQLLLELLRLQREQLELTRELVRLSREAHEIRARQHAELLAWQERHEGVVERCREVVSTLTQIHAGVLGDMADYINENAEALLESDFSISEFVDKFGPRLHHLSTMLAVFKQLSAPLSRPDTGRRQ